MRKKLQALLLSILRLNNQVYSTEHEKVESLQYWRERIVDSLYAILVIFGFIAYVPSVYAAFLEKDLTIAIVNTLAYGMAVYIYLSDRFSFRSKAGFILAAVYTIAISLMTNIYVGYSLMWIFVAPLLAGILLGMRASIFAIAGNILILTSYAGMIHYGDASWDPIANDPLFGWAVLSINFIFLNFITTFSVVTLVEKLKLTILDSEKINKRLKNVIEKNKSLARRIVVIQEEERKILSQDLHDEIGQNLTALQLHINTAKQYQAPVQLSSVIKSIDEIISVTYRSAYELMHWLRPMVLDEYGLQHALSNHIFKKMLKESNINYILDVKGNLNLINSELSSSIYRIVQECICNAAKYSQATNLWVSFHLTDSELNMAIKDDGIGFDIMKIDEGGSSFGLRGIQDRVDAMNGIYHLTSNNEGTSYSFIFKLKNDEDRSTN